MARAQGSALVRGGLGPRTSCPPPQTTAEGDYFPNVSLKPAPLITPAVLPIPTPYGRIVPEFIWERIRRSKASCLSWPALILLWRQPLGLVMENHYTPV